MYTITPNPQVVQSRALPVQREYENAVVIPWVFPFLYYGGEPIFQAIQKRIDGRVNGQHYHGRPGVSSVITGRVYTSWGECIHHADAVIICTRYANAVDTCTQNAANTRTQYDNALKLNMAKCTAHFRIIHMVTPSRTW